MKHLFGPIYDTIRQHKCLLVKEKPDLPRDMKMPIYEFGDVGHKFVGGQILLPEVDKEKNLAGPIYKIDDPTHHFDIIIQSAKAMKELQGMFFKHGTYLVNKETQQVETHFIKNFVSRRFML